MKISAAQLYQKLAIEYDLIGKTGEIKFTLKDRGL